MSDCDSVVDYETFDGKMTNEGSNQPKIFEQHKPKLMDPRKFHFVQKYLEDNLETRSATTEASDSALGTQAAASELGTEEISETDKLYLKDLNKHVIMELSEKINRDSAVLEKFSRFFGIKHSSSFRWFHSVCQEYFPGTTVGMLKECFEALQLYDLVDLLEKAKPPSLRAALSPEEVGKLRDDRPTKDHTNVAVLVVNDSAEGDSAEKIEAFFKDLNSQNEVTVIASKISQETRKVLEKINEMKNRENSLKEMEKIIKNRLEIELPRQMDSLNKKIQMHREGELVPEIPRGKSKRRVRRNLPSTMLNELNEEAVRISHQLDELTKEIAELAERMKTAEDGGARVEELEKEKEKAKTALSMAMEEWIRNQEKFTLIAVFVIIDGTSFYDHTALRQCVEEKLALIPNHTKLVVAPYTWDGIHKFPETIYVANKHKAFLTSLIEIFNKRWQKLDLIAMMQELSRTVPRYFRPQAHSELKEDKLSTLPRFQKMQEEGSL